MYKDVWKKAAALFLCACMAGTSVDLTAFTVHAQEQTATEEKVEAEKTEQPEITDETTEDAQKSEVQTEAVNQEEEQSVSTYIAPLVEEQEVPVLGAPDGVTELTDANTAIVLSASTYTYDGTEKKPTVTVVCNGVRLTQNTDFLLTYADHVNAGTASLTIVGLTNYTGSLTKNFTIKTKNLNDSSITASPTVLTNVVYTGKPVTPVVTLKDKSTVLYSDVDYTITFDKDAAQRVEAGVSARMTLTGKNNYTGTRIFDFTIDKKNVADTDVSISYDSVQSYTGSAVTPEVTLMYNGELMVKDRDYKITYSNNIAASSSAAITITGTGNFKGKVNKVFTISSSDIASASITLDTDSYVYDGNPKKPGATVKLTDDKGKEKTLRLGTDYSIEYKDNTNAGEASVVVKGKGNYTGTCEKTFTISARSMSDSQYASEFMIQAIPDQYYLGKNEQVKPTITVQREGEELKLGTDYTVQYYNNTTVSTDSSKAKVAVYGKGNYKDEISAEYNIVKVPMDNVTISDIDNWTKLGTAPNPAVTVTYNNVTLRRGTDYTIEYVDESGKALTNAAKGMTGVVRITATADSVYEGITSKDFWICYDIADTLASDVKAEYLYTGKDIEPAPTIKTTSGKTLKAGVDYTVSYNQDTVNAGDKTITIYGMGEYAGETTCAYKVTPKPLTASDITYTATSPVYTGSTVKPEVTVKNGDVTLSEGIDYEIEEVTDAAADEYIKAGEGKRLKIVAKSGSNYTGTKEITYTIAPRPIADAAGKAASDIEVQGLDGLEELYTGSPITVSGIKVLRNAAELTEITDYVITYGNNTNAGTANVYITGKGNYTGMIQESFDIKYDFSKVTGKTMLDGQEETEFEYDGGQQIRPTMKLTYDDLANQISNELSSSDYVVTGYSGNINAGAENGASVTLEGRGLYKGTLTLNFTVIPKYIDSEDILVADAINTPVYDGESHKINNLTIYFRQALELGTDYNLTKYVDSGDNDPSNTNSDCINAGTITITVEGVGNYQGTREVTRYIAQKSIEDSDIEVTQMADIVYDGQPHKLTADQITAVYNRYNSTPLSLTSADYTVTSWKNTGDDPDEEDSECINAGTVTITLEAKGNYTGTRTIVYRIIPKSLIKSDGSIADDIHASITGGNTTVYNREVQDPEVTVTADGIETLSDKDMTITYLKEVTTGSSAGTYTEVDECKDAGNYKIRVTGKGNYSGSFDLSYTIQQRNLNEDAEDYRFAIEPISDQTYTGDAIIPEELKVFEYAYDASAPDDKSNENAVLGEDDYNVTGTNNIDVTSDIQKAELTIEGKGNYTGTLTTEFVILPKNINDKTDSVYDVGLTEILEVEYTGELLTPVLPLKYNGHDLVEGTDYQVSYQVADTDEEGNPIQVDTNRDVGPVYGTIEGTGNYIGTRTFTVDDPIFKIVPRSIKRTYESGELTVEAFPSYVYDGKEHKPEVVIRDTFKGTEPLVEGIDYTVVYEETVNTGTNTVRITGIGNYGEEIELTYKIIPKSLFTGSGADSAMVEGSRMEEIAEQTYTGAEITPGIGIFDTINDAEVQLEEGRDYTIAYQSNTNAGTATAVITFCGNYTGYYDAIKDTYYNSYQKTFQIVPRDIADENIIIESIDDQEYDKNPKEPEPVITFGATTLVKGVDYTLEYSENHTDSGTVTITVTGINNFKNTRTTTYQITPKSLDSADIQVAAIDNQDYTGSNVVPDVTVTYGTTVLKKGVDYQCEAGTNTVKPGTATVVIKGIGNYGGQVTKDFKIIGNLESNGRIETIAPQAYTGTTVKPAATVTFGGSKLIQGTDYNIDWNNNIEVGTATVTITGTGVYKGMITGTFNIAYDLAANGGNKVETNSIADEYTYQGSAIAPITQVSYSGQAMTAGTDYILTYSQNTNVGTVKITITGIGKYTGSVSRSFKIVKKNLANCTYSSVSGFDYDGTEKTPTVTIKNGTRTLSRGTDYTLQYKNNKNAGVGQVIISGAGNYSGTVIRYFNINVLQPTGLRMESSKANSVKLVWSFSGKATGYEIYRKQSDGKYKKIATTKKTTYTNKKLAPSTSYKYKVRAYVKNSTGTVYGKFTSVVIAKTTPATPKVTVTSPKAKQVKVKWKGLASASGYEVYRSTSKNGKYTLVKTINKRSTVTYVNKKLKSNKTYYYKVRAFKSSKGVKTYGSYSSAKKIKVK